VWVVLAVKLDDLVFFLVLVKSETCHAHFKYAVPKGL